MLTLALGFCLPQASQAQSVTSGNMPAPQQMQGDFRSQGVVQDPSGAPGSYGVGYPSSSYGGGYQGGGYQRGYQGGYQGGYQQGGFEGAQSADHIDPNQEYTIGEPQDNGCGQCYCLCCKYEPCYYNTWRTECCPVMCKKKCCHYVPKYYEKCCVRYVPQQYSQTCCKYEPEYYYVDECKYVSKRVCDRHCKYVPKYYYKTVCNPNPCCEPCCP